MGEFLIELWAFMHERKMSEPLWGTTKQAAFTATVRGVDLIPLPGYLAMRQLPNGRVIGILPQFCTTGLVVDITEYSYEYSYCYDTVQQALEAYRTWDGAGDPPGPWLKLKGHRERPEESGPGWQEYITRKAPG